VNKCPFYQIVESNQKNQFSPESECASMWVDVWVCTVLVR